LTGGVVLERPGAVKGAPLFGAAKRTLDCEDRSKRIELEGKDRGKVSGLQSDPSVQNIAVRYTMTHFLDTNILLYSISRNPAESLKRDQAVALLDDDSGALSIQVLQEFYVQATRASRADAVPHQLAAGLIEAWSRFRIQDMTLPILTAALRIRKAHGFSFWDSTILAAALALGCDRVYTEDLTHGHVVDGLTIVDPFR
jgi:predicted nucleic acid-binding protein